MDHIGHAPPFAWGSNDCALWAARWVLAATGQNFLADWEGKYKTENGAARLMKKRGFSGPEDIAAAHLPPIPLTLARRGDLVLHPQGALGVCFGRTSYFLTLTGLTTLNTLDCERAWAVG